MDLVVTRENLLKLLKQINLETGIAVIGKLCQKKI